VYVFIDPITGVVRTVVLLTYSHKVEFVAHNPEWVMVRTSVPCALLDEEEGAVIAAESMMNAPLSAENPQGIGVFVWLLAIFVQIGTPIGVVALMPPVEYLGSSAEANTVPTKAMIITAATM
jgi:hypothetical protein